MMGWTMDDEPLSSMVYRPSSVHFISDGRSLDNVARYWTKRQQQLDDLDISERDGARVGRNALDQARQHLFRTDLNDCVDAARDHLLHGARPLNRASELLGQLGAQLLDGRQRLGADIGDQWHLGWAQDDLADELVEMQRG